MQILTLTRKAIASLRRPFIQRLIMLVVFILLAMSLISMAIVFVLRPLEREVASSASRWLVQPIYWDGTRAQSIVLMVYMHGPGNVQAIQQYDIEGGLL